MNPLTKALVAPLAHTLPPTPDLSWAPGTAAPVVESRVHRGGLRRQLAWYIGLSFGVPYALAGFAYAHGRTGQFPELPLAMLCPMLAAIFVQRVIAGQPVFRTGGLGLRVGRWREWLVFPLAAGAIVASIFALTFILHPALLADRATIATNVTKLQAVPYDGQSVLIRLLLAYGITLVIGPLLNIPLFLGEEIGWRGFMNPRLVALFGKPGLIVGGLIWAVWHTPFILLGLNYPQHPVLGLLIWVPVCITGGILLQAVVTRARSIVPAALCHGVVNQLAAVTFTVFAVEPRLRDLVDGPSGLASLLVLAPLAWYAYRTMDAAEIVAAVGPAD